MSLFKINLTPLLYNFSLNQHIFLTIFIIFILSFVGLFAAIDIKFKSPWKKNVKNYDERFYREVKKNFSGNELVDKDSLESCRSWFSKAKIFDIIKGSGYYLSIILLVYYILWLIGLALFQGY